MNWSLENHPSYRKAMAVVERVAAHRTTVRSKKAAIETRLQSFARSSAAHVRAAELLAGDDGPLESDPVLVSQLGDCNRELSAVEIALEDAKNNLIVATGQASHAICRDARPEYAPKLRAVLKAAIELAKAQQDERDFRSDLEAAGISAASLPVCVLHFPLGKANDSNTILGNYAREIERDHGIKA